MDAARGTVLPLRPLTVGELLDASVALLRRCGWPLLALGLLCSAGQFTLAGMVRIGLAEAVGPTPAGWLWLACWLGSESVAICILAAPASARAVGVLLGEPAGRGALSTLTAPGRRWPAALLAAGVVGVLAGVGVLLCGVGWIVVYALTGLVVPVLLADRVSDTGVLSRPLRLVFAGAGRAGGIRLLAYLGWLAVRLAVGVAAGLLLGRLALTGDPWLLRLLSAAPWVLVDAIAYPTLACLDACVHLENRMRTEGLDLALSRAGGGRGTARSVVEVV